MGSGGGLSLIGSIAPAVLGTITAPFDFAQASEAAQMRRDKQNEAIWDFERKSKEAIDDAEKWAGTIRRNQAGLVDRAAQNQMKNVNDWYDRYSREGGMTAKAKDAQADALRYSKGYAFGDKYQQAQKLNTNMIQGVQNDIRKYQSLGQEFRDQFSDRFSQDQADLDEEYGERISDVDRVADFAGVKVQNQQILDELRNERGQYNALSAAQPILQNRDASLRQLDDAYRSGEMSYEQYQAQRQATLQGSTEQIQDTVQKAGHQASQLAAQTQVALQQNMNDLKQAVMGNKTGLFQSWASNKTQGALQAASLVAGSLSDEMAYVNQARAVQTKAADQYGRTFAYSQSELQNTLRQTTENLWNAISADEKARTFALVDAPNAIIQQSTAEQLQIDSNYLSAVMSISQARVNAAQTESAMRYNFDPAFASASGYVQGVQSMWQSALDSSLAWQANERAGKAQRQANELGWFGAGVDAVSAVTGGFTKQTGENMANKWFPST